MSKILIVEDDKMLNDGLYYALTKEGHNVVQNDGKQAITGRYDLVLLDINLPYKDGFELAQTIDDPIIFITAKSMERDILKGFSHGCEDYITKPFSIAVLLEKVKVVLRRFGSSYAYGNLSYDQSKKELLIDEKFIDLTKKEHQIISYLIEHKEHVISKRQLLENVWDIEGDFVNEGTVNVTINRLRKKMDPNALWIQTVFGIGYKWSEKHEK